MELKKVIAFYNKSEKRAEIIFEKSILFSNNLEKDFNKKKIIFYQKNKSFIVFYKFKEKYISPLKQSGHKLILKIEKEKLISLLREISIKNIEILDVE